MARGAAAYRVRCAPTFDRIADEAAFFEELQEIGAWYLNPLKECGGLRWALYASVKSSSRWATVVIVMTIATRRVSAEPKCFGYAERVIAFDRSGRYACVVLAETSFGGNLGGSVLDTRTGRMRSDITCANAVPQPGQRPAPFDWRAADRDLPSEIDPRVRVLVVQEADGSLRRLPLRLRPRDRRALRDGLRECMSFHCAKVFLGSEWIVAVILVPTGRDDCDETSERVVVRSWRR